MQLAMPKPCQLRQAKAAAAVLQSSMPGPSSTDATSDDCTQAEWPHPKPCFRKLCSFSHLSMDFRPAPVTISSRPPVARMPVTTSEAPAGPRHPQSPSLHLLRDCGPAATAADPSVEKALPFQEKPWQQWPAHPEPEEGTTKAHSQHCHRAAVRLTPMKSCVMQVVTSTSRVLVVMKVLQQVTPEAGRHIGAEAGSEIVSADSPVILPADTGSLLQAGNKPEVFRVHTDVGPQARGEMPREPCSARRSSTHAGVGKSQCGAGTWAQRMSNTTPLTEVKSVNIHSRHYHANTVRHQACSVVAMQNEDKEESEGMEEHAGRV
ncbi:hypothetical protein TREES_T100002968 [Tupaia chinensis]|uniref:Uncharacterized protein n=1 Tax=Tupaia chinensis TaxID=246437 RepID=L9KQN6_TUPCH|nr:hypothetical protein TREES_T100002968 [Tupaia chinensis]